jgi:hypothetical protein
MFTRKDLKSQWVIQSLYLQFYIENCFCGTTGFEKQYFG